MKGSRSPTDFSDSKGGDGDDAKSVQETAQAKGISMSPQLTISSTKSGAVDDEEDDIKGICTGMPDFDDSPAKHRRTKVALRPVATGKLNPDAFAAPKPLAGHGLGGYSALPSINSDNSADETRRQAADEIRRGQEQFAQHRQQQDEYRKEVQEVDPEEEAKRAKHMAEQRDRLLAMKKAERDKRVRAEEERQAKMDTDGDTIPESVLKAKAKEQANQRLAENCKDSTGDPDKEAIDERRRAQMRIVLARRMKLDLIESEETKLAQMQGTQFADLDRKLQQVEQVRRDNRQREQMLTEQIKQQQAAIASNVKRSAAELNHRDNNI